jgi:transketolase
LTAPSAEALALAARTIRVLTVDAVRQAGIGHVGLPLGCAEVGSVLFGEVLRHDPADPAWPDRDRFVLSAGHGSMLLYSLLHLSGYAISSDDLRRFRQLGSITPGHPEHGPTPGVECTTGPLGQGFANAVGMALAERVLAASFGGELVDHRTYVLASDGDLMEGVASEAASLAGHLGLGRLIVLYDDNGVTIDGPASLTFSENVPLRFEAYGWEVQRVDGHDVAAVRAALARAAEAEDRPHLIACRTHIGFGSPAVDTAAAHGAIPDEAVEQTREALGWTLPPFQVPDAARAFFRPNAERGAALRQAWLERRRRAFKDSRVAERWRAMYERALPDDLLRTCPDFRGEPPLATRQASGRIVNALASAVPGLIGGSGDLTGSNNTAIKGAGVIARDKYDGRNLHYGVREHGMAGIANGLALHGGLRPYVGTFLVFSDYMRPSIRLAAMSEQPVVYVFTHDSIFVGEDGPTHQPIEQLAALRAIPNLDVWRPADARETATAWLAALERDRGPVALVLTRQAVPSLEAEGVERAARAGGYVLLAEPGEGTPELIVAGTGSETHLALAAARTLQGQGRRVRAVSLPCLEQFLRLDPAARRAVLPDAAPRLLVEAGVELGLAQLLRPGDRFHGMTRFGASAPYKTLAEEFGFTAESVTAVAREMLA